MKIRNIITSAVFLLGSISVLPAQTTLTAREVQEKAIEATRVKGTEAVSTMTIMDGRGGKRVRQIAQATKLYDNGRTEKKLIRFLAPADVKGTGFLTFDYRDKDDDKWLYMPALRKSRRIVSSENAKSFMGSEFSYADITPPTVEDFSYRFLADSIVNGTACRQVEMTPLDDDIADAYGFSRKILFIGKDDFVPRRAVYYDIDEELHKILSVNEVKEIDPKNKKFRMMEMVMENQQNGRTSIIKTDKVVFNPSVKDDYFSMRYLTKN